MMKKLKNRQNNLIGNIYNLIWGQGDKIGVVMMKKINKGWKNNTRNL